MRSIAFDDASTSAQLEAHYAAALAALREDGIVCLTDVIDRAHIDALNDKMQADMEVRTPSRKANAWNGLRPPPFAPYLFNDIVYNEHAIEICRALLGPNATLTTYGANTSWPGQDSAQRVHRDVPDGPTLACPAVVLNMPLTPFTLENGATMIYPGSHLEDVTHVAEPRVYPPEMLAARAAVRAPEQTAGIAPGDLVIRDLRLWHHGMPNTSDERRVMLALVVIDPDYREADESGFKGFEAEQGSEAFFSHPRLQTSVHFVPPGDRDYYMHGHHSTPPTPLQQDWDARTRA